MSDNISSVVIGVDAKGVAGLFPFSIRTWRRLDSACRCPRGYRVGGRKLWNFDELKIWSELGYPTREHFEILKKAGHGE